MKLKRWIGSPTADENYKHSYRLIKDEKERLDWIKKNWEIEE